MESKQEKIAKVFGGGSSSTLVHLNEEQADKFIDYIVDESVVLKSSRVVRMSTPRKVIGKIGISDEILYPAQRGQALDPSKRVSATPDKITLISEEVIGEVRIHDDELEDNIEGSAFKDHMMQMVAKKIWNQLEKVALYSRKVANPFSLMQMFDGFVKKIETNGWVVVDATDTGLFADRFIDKEKLAKLRKSIATKYRSMLNKWYMSDDLAIDYEVKYEATQNVVNRYGAFGIDFTKANIVATERPVPVTSGFTATLTASPVAGATSITVDDTTGATAGDTITIALGEDKEFSTTIETVTSGTVLALDDALPFGYTHTDAKENTITETTLDGADVILTPDFNFIYGIQRDITIEPDRVPKERATDFVITMRACFEVENPEMTGILKNVKVK